MQTPWKRLLVEPRILCHHLALSLSPSTKAPKYLPYVLYHLLQFPKNYSYYYLNRAVTTWASLHLAFHNSYRLNKMSDNYQLDKIKYYSIYKRCATQSILVLIDNVYYWLTELILFDTFLTKSPFVCAAEFFRGENLTT